MNGNVMKQIHAHTKGNTMSSPLHKQQNPFSFTHKQKVNQSQTFLNI